MPAEARAKCRPVLSDSGWPYLHTRISGEFVKARNPSPGGYKRRDALLLLKVSRP